MTTELKTTMGQLSIARGSWRSDPPNQVAVREPESTNTSTDAGAHAAGKGDLFVLIEVRGPASNPGAHVTAMNNIIYNNLKAVRYEDGIENLHIYNNTFGLNNGQFFESAGGAGVDFQVLNNLLAASSKPQEANDSSNLAVANSNFVDAVSNDYHLVNTSQAIDSGTAIAEVTTDKDGVLRPQNSAYDVGAYEFQGTPANLGKPGTPIHVDD